MIDRREFLKVTALAGGGFVMGVSFVGCASGPKRQMEELARETGQFSPNAFITITPDDRILVAVEKSEMGQGILTSHAMLVAEELGVEPDRVEAASAAGDPAYGSTAGMQLTGGSTSLLESYVPIRTAAASAREMLVAAAAARWGVSPAECEVGDGRVTHAASKRKASFGELATDAAKQPIPQSPPLKEPGDFRVIGKDVRRVDARAKVDGTATFGIDVEVPEMVKAFVIRPPRMGAEPLSVDASEARREPGVIDVVPYSRGVGVVAEKFWQARRAADRVVVEWGATALDGVDSAALEALALDAVMKRGGTVTQAGDVGRALGREDVTVVEAVYHAPYLSHAALEPMNCTADVRDGEVEIWAPTQSPTITEEVAANICGLRRDDVTVHVTLLGGGFGRRAAPDFVADAVELSRRVGRPVQVVWSREDDMKGGYYRPSAVSRMQGAIDQEGAPVALRYHSVVQSIMTDALKWTSAAFPQWMSKRRARSFTGAADALFRSGSVPDIISTEGASHTPYDIAHRRTEYTPIRTSIPVCFWRSVGHSYNGFVMESFIDELAHAADADPFEFRRRNMKNERLRAVMERAAEEGGWGRPIEEGWARGIAAHESFDSYVAEVIEAGVFDGEIKVRKVTCVVDCGVVVNPDIVRQNMEGGIIFGLSAALYQKITLEDGVIQQGNYDDFRLLRMHETPEIDVHIMNSSESPTGVGEPGLPPAAPALANAIFAATGVRLRRMPFQDAWKEQTAEASR